MIQIAMKTKNPESYPLKKKITKEEADKEIWVDKVFRKPVERVEIGGNEDVRVGGLLMVEKRKG